MYDQITIADTDVATQEILIALMSDLGYDSFQQEGGFLHAFIQTDLFDQEGLEELLRPMGLGWARSSLPQKNWNEAWEKDFEPVVVGDFCAIRASFHNPMPGVRHELIITPKMSFGTGHHATTFLMIQAMEALELEGKTVLDFGTGTGVLAILALRLGAARVRAIDNDDWSVRNALENIGVNGAAAIQVEKGETVPSDERFDVILANVNRHVILQELGRMGQQLKKDGVILLSGLLEDDYQVIEKEALRNGTPISVRLMKNNWICLKITKKDN